MNMFRKLRTWAQFDAASLEDRRQWAREFLQLCERAFQKELQDDMAADQRAFQQGHGDLDPGPIDEAHPQSSTNRTADNL